MSDFSDEKKISDTLLKLLNRASFSPGWVVFHFMQRNSDIHNNMFQLIMQFLRQYADMYYEGRVEPGDKMFRICQMSFHMLDSLYKADIPPATPRPEPLRPTNRSVRDLGYGAAIDLENLPRRGNSFFPNA